MGEIDSGDGLKAEHSFFVDKDEVFNLINDISGDGWEKIWQSHIESLDKILSKYQEQPMILGPYIEEMVQPLMSCLAEVVHNLDNNINNNNNNIDNNFIKSKTMSHFHATCSCLYIVCRVRGYKHVSKHFPHEVSQLENCILLLQIQNRKDYETWHSRYIVLLWLRMLCLIPFDICTVDSTLKLKSSSSDTPGTGGAETSSKVVTVIRSLCQDFLEEPGPTREAASFCLSALLTRPDMESTVLFDFVAWASSALAAWLSKGNEAENELTHDSFRLLGTLACLAAIFKTGHREKILPHAMTILGPCLVLHSQPNQTKTRKLLSKISQRIGMTFLPPRVAKWRYQRGNRSLKENLNKENDNKNSNQNNNKTNEDDDEDEDDVPDQLEDIIELLLFSVQDRDTVVRWSAAKGIGRITMRLPRLLADDVVEAILELFEDSDDDAAWHGGCLCLAELARRGLLLPERLKAVVPIIGKAMHFDVLRGQHSVGSHVRDAACYVCWAFARAYSPQVMKDHVSDLAKAMLLTAVYDREVNCRRAASAAFQENVGRQGNENFNKGIEIITIADYFSLGNRNSAYLSIGPSLADIANWYLEPFVDHLISTKVSHWDKEIRILASKGLATLVSYNPELFIGRLEKIIPMCCGNTLPCRHGSTLACAEILHALALEGVPLSSTIIDKIVNILYDFNRLRLYRGRGGEILREAACLLIELIARSNLEISTKTQKELVEMLNENVKQPHENIQMASISALRHFLHVYFPVGSDGPSERLEKLTVQRYLTGLTSPDNAAIARGSAMALGILPIKLATKHIIDIVEVLKTAANPNHLVAGEADAETRRNAVTAMLELTERLLPSTTELFPDIVQYCIDTIMVAANDYSVDKRGDIGSWSRTESLKGIPRILLALQRHRQSVLLGNFNDDNATVLCVYGRAALKNKLNDNVSELEFYPYTTATNNMKINDTKVLQSTITSSPPVSLTSENKEQNLSLGLKGVEDMISFVLKQLSEKLDALRELAGNVLQTLLIDIDDTYITIPHKNVLKQCFLLSTSTLKQQENCIWGRPHVIFPRVVSILDAGVYFRPILEGITISIGGLTEEIYKESSKAFLLWCNKLHNDGRTVEIHTIMSTLLEIMDKYSKDTRVTLPVLKTIDFLYKKGVFGDKVNGTAVTEYNILKTIKSEMNQCGDVIKLIACINVIFHLLSRSGNVRQFALRSLLMLLGHKYPRIRKYTAEQLYVHFVSDNDSVGNVLYNIDDPLSYDGKCAFVTNEDYLNKINTILTETPWNTEILECRKQRTLLCSIFNIDLNIKAKTNANKKKESDELDCYSALVREVGY